MSECTSIPRRPCIFQHTDSDPSEKPSEKYTAGRQGGKENQFWKRRCCSLLSAAEGGYPSKCRVCLWYQMGLVCLSLSNQMGLVISSCETPVDLCFSWVVHGMKCWYSQIWSTYEHSLCFCLEKKNIKTSSQAPSYARWLQPETMTHWPTDWRGWSVELLA